ncbi:MAG TPA: PilZ domain-containing protein [Terriglobales bacterium]|nr:PilZ domain-containing protein [Terriglobales bacterium]
MGAHDKIGNTDRRKWERVELDSRVRLFVYRENEQLQLNGQLSDLSEGGLSIFLATDLSEGDVVEAEINLPYASKPTRFKAVVRSRSSFRYGLEFLDVTPPLRKIISRACGVLKLVD